MTFRTALIIAGAAILLVIGGMFMASLVQPPINWSSTFSRYDNIPFGSKLVYERLQDLFPGQPVSLASDPAETVLAEAVSTENNASEATVQPAPGGIGTYLLIGSTYPVTEDALDALLSFVRQGGTVFLSDLRTDSDPLLRFLELEWAYQPVPLQGKDSLATMDFQDLTTGQTTSLTVSKEASAGMGYSFSRFAPNGKVLVQNKLKQPVLVEIPYGAGSFYACATPHLFTNYYLLVPGADRLVAAMFSHLPASPKARVLWDESYKHVAREREEDQQSLLRFIHKHPTLEWAFYLLLALIGVYILSEMRRKQREIPVIEPLPNATLEFAGTIGSLYFRNKDHLNIAEKKIRYFHEYVRNRFYLRVHEGDDASVQALAGRSGVPADELTPLFQLIARIRRSKALEEDVLVDLSARLDRFYQQTTS